MSVDSTAGSTASVLALKRWKCIYPAYINSKKTVAEGRRLKREKCVENPTCQEIKDILDNAGLRTVLEPKKMFPRDMSRDLGYQGRVKVELLNDEHNIINGKFPHKLAVLHYLGESIPKLKGRVNSSASQSSSTAGASQSGTSNKGKQKGKGNKRR